MRWLRGLRKYRGEQRSSKRRRPRTAGRRLTLEALETRELLSTFTVVNTAGGGPGSLRQAIVAANTAPGADTIAFNIPGNGAQTIKLHTSLPAVTETVTIDGYTQPGSQPDTLATGWNGKVRIAITPDQFSGPGYGLHLQSDNNELPGGESLR